MRHVFQGVVVTVSGSGTSIALLFHPEPKKVRVAGSATTAPSIEAVVMEAHDLRRDGGHPEAVRATGHVCAATDPHYFCASGAATRNVTRLSGRIHGYGAPGMFSTLGLQSAGGCCQALVPPTHRHTPATSAVKILGFTGFSLRIPKSTEPGQTHQRIEIPSIHASSRHCRGSPALAPSAETRHR